MRLLFLLTLLGIAILPGCGTSVYTPGPRNFDRGVQALNTKNYVVAYRFLEEPSPGTERETLSLMKAHPQLIAAGETTFTPSALTASIQRYGREQAFQIEHARLQRFAVYANPDRFRAAAEALASAFPSELAAYYEKEAERARVAKLPEAEQQRYWAEAFRRSVESETTRGVIMSAQIVDRSRPGTTGGAAVGATLAQAIYIDSASWQSYRATNQLAAGILGALVGSSVDQRPAVMFQKVYFIRTVSGEVRRVDEQSSDPVTYPVGACLEFREPFHLALTEDRRCKQQ